jgi:mono/diheme cytochrome c family protein
MVLRLAIVVVLAFAGGAWFLTRPVPLAADALDGLTGDVANGAIIFAASGCASCHTAPGAETEGLPVLAGGRAFASDFGTFMAPNISSDPKAGIGAWTDLELASAIQRGVSPEGTHYYPAFPYTAYAKAAPQDIVDLIAYLRTLPADASPSLPHDLDLPFRFRAGLGGWKLRFGSSDWVMPDPVTPVVARGRYLVEALGHCAECHTPRNALGGLQRDRWMAGAPAASGPGRVPNITTGGLSWSFEEVAEYLKSGFTPEFDTAGGEMVEVIKNTSQLSDADRRAIASYLAALPPLGPDS